jgi:uncharacterized membrane protein YidH (DUF202 family)
VVVLTNTCGNMDQPSRFDFDRLHKREAWLKWGLVITALVIVILEAAPLIAFSKSRQYVSVVFVLVSVVIVVGGCVTLARVKESLRTNCNLSYD